MNLSYVRFHAFVNQDRTTYFCWKLYIWKKSFVEVIATEPGGKYEMNGASCDGSGISDKSAAALPVLLVGPAWEADRDRVVLSCILNACTNRWGSRGSVQERGTACDLKGPPWETDSRLQGRIQDFGGGPAEFWPQGSGLSPKCAQNYLKTAWFRKNWGGGVRGKGG